MSTGERTRVRRQPTRGVYERESIEAILDEALLPRLALTPLHQGVVARPLGKEAPTRRVRAARLAEGFLSPASEAMLQILSHTAAGFLAESRVAA